MNHLFVPYQEAKILKELFGFDEPCLGFSSSIHPEKITLDDNCFLSFYTLTNKNIDSDVFITRPTYEQAFNFLLPIAQRGLGFDEIVLEIYSYDLIEKLYGPSQTETLLSSGKLESLQKLIEIAKTKINI